jgi:hypothetical protein
MLCLQGDLQVVFDTLYEMGVIEPVLEKDWKPGLEEMKTDSPRLLRAIGVVNGCGKDRGLLRLELARLDRSTLEILAMEVAREYADYHLRTSLH